MDSKIITLPSAKIREIARVALEGSWKQVVLFMFFYYLITTGVSNVLNIFFVSTQELPFGDSGEVLTQTIAYGSQIYITLVGGPLSWALSKFLLDFFRYQKAEQTTLFEGFSIFAKTTFLLLLMGAKIFLWSLLFIVPGIIAIFRYSQAFYVMVDHPEYSANQCLQESSRIMAGNKFKFLCLQLSFIGWELLAGLPAFCFSKLLAEASEVAFVFLDVVFTIPMLFVNAYLNVALTVFYELAIDNLTIVDDTAPESVSESSGNWDPSMYSAPTPEEVPELQEPAPEEPAPEEPALQPETENPSETEE